MTFSQKFPETLEETSPRRKGRCGRPELDGTSPRPEREPRSQEVSGLPVERNCFRPQTVGRRNVRFFWVNVEEVISEENYGCLLHVKSAGRIFQHMKPNRQRYLF